MTQKFDGYKLVRQNSNDQFDKEITNLINDGWEPWGNPFTAGQYNSPCQAMIKYKVTPSWWEGSTSSTGPK